ncbi:MAG: IS110 family transposase [Desulfuromonadaceae bacterium]|nr:IS110 family transposase [Desulfuromonadaceae bacterium]
MAADIIGKVSNIEQFPTAKHLIGYVSCHPRVNSSDTKEGRPLWAPVLPLFDHKEKQGFDGELLRTYLTLGPFRFHFLFIPTFLRH